MFYGYVSCFQFSVTENIEHRGICIFKANVKSIKFLTNKNGNTLLFCNIAPGHSFKGHENTNSDG